MFTYEEINSISFEPSDKRTYAFYNGPLIYHFLNRENDMYLVYVVRQKKDGQNLCVVFKIANNEWNSLKRNCTSIYDLCKNHIDDTFYLVQINWNKEKLYKRKVPYNFIIGLIPTK